MEKPLESQNQIQDQNVKQKRVLVEGYTDPISQRKYELNAVEHSLRTNYIEKLEIIAMYDQEAKRITIYPEFCESRLCAIDIYVRRLVYEENWIVLEARVNVMRNSLPYFFTLKALQSAIMVKELPVVIRDILAFINQAFNTELKL